jgi:translation initiation factor IF-2
MEGLLSPIFKEKYLGRAEVREVFSVPKIGNVAGCYVQDGKVIRNAQVRLTRDNIVVYEGKMSSLRRFKDDVKDASSGYECGIGLENYNDIKIGDMIEAFEMEKIAATL